MKINKSKIPRGEGKIVSSDGAHSLAVYHGDDGTFLVFSADCPHAHCDVIWNKHDNAWDCPCHGSRFSKDGAVLNGPAEQSLTRLLVKDAGEDIEVAESEKEPH